MNGCSHKVAVPMVETVNAASEVVERQRKMFVLLNVQIYAVTLSQKICAQKCNASAIRAVISECSVFAAMRRVKQVIHAAVIVLRDGRDD